MKKFKMWLKGKYVSFLYSLAFGRSDRLHKWAMKQITNSPCTCTYCDKANARS